MLAAMSLLRELKTLLEHEQRLGGPFAPLPAPVAQASRNAAPGERGPSEAIRQAASAPGDANDDLFDSGTEQDKTGGDEERGPSPYARIHALIPEESPLREMTALDDVEAFVRNTTLIPLDERRTNPVFGVGNPAADLMVIGEAPGQDEDLQGEPFVGRAGQLLNKILKAIDFEREDVYIANILKSRPPNNRNPNATEIRAHAPILYKQMAIIQPRLLLCLGKVAAGTLLDRQDSLGAMRGVFHDFHGLPLLVTYHPAALLRNPSWKRAAWEDVQKLRERYNQVSPAA